MKIKIKKLNSEAIIPRYQTEGAAGFDLHSAESVPFIIPAKGKVIIGTGLAFEIPVGYEMQVRPRSGMAAKNSIIVINSPGTVDSDFRGEVKVILGNLSDKDYIVNPSDRIAQGVIAAAPQFEFEEEKELSNTERGKGGFGHTGK